MFMKIRRRLKTFVLIFGVIIIVVTVIQSFDNSENENTRRLFNPDVLKKFRLNVSNSETSFLTSYFGNFSTAPPCDEIPPNLEGPISFDVDLESADVLNFDAASLREKILNGSNQTIREGGWWQPIGCAARHHVVVIIPYRYRSSHLAILLSYLHPILQRQLIDYRIVVVEQFGNDTFNKGRLMNTAFKTVQSMFPQYNCVVFHDVDLVPEDDRNLYYCGEYPKHMSSAVSKFNYTLPYKELIGGVLAVRFEHYVKVNGYSNVYWGWGGEDDDLFYRMKFEKLHIIRPPHDISRYTMMYHIKRTWLSHAKTYKLLGRNRRRYKKDGLNSITYEQIWIKTLPLYTHILVNIGLPPKD